MFRACEAVCLGASCYGVGTTVLVAGCYAPAPWTVPFDDHWSRDSRGAWGAWFVERGHVDVHWVHVMEDR